MRTFVVALLATLALTAAAPAATSPGLTIHIATLDTAAPVAAFNTVTAWSQRDATTGMFKLVVLRGRSYHEVAVKPRAVPFDVDVGPGPDGHPWVVYSRCSVEPPASVASGVSVIPDYTQSRNCHLYAWDVYAGVERRLAAGRNAVLPSIWHGRIAYVRLDGARPRVGPVAGGRTIRGGRGHGRPIWMDLYGKRLAIVWKRNGLRELRLGPRVVARTQHDVRLLGMGFDRGILYFRTTCVGARARCPETFWAYRPRSHRSFFAAGVPDVVAATHAHGNTISLLGHDTGAAIGCSESAPCELRFEDQLEFSEVPR